MDIKRKLTRYGYHVLIAIDQLFNALIGGAADETLSSRTYRGAVLAKYPRKRWRIWYRVINAVFFRDYYHLSIHQPDPPTVASFLFVVRHIPLYYKQHARLVAHVLNSSQSNHY